MTDPGTDPGGNPPGGKSATLTASPSTVSQGGTVTLHGSGFLPGEDVVITLPTGGTMTVSADADGAFVATWKVPADQALGAAHFSARGLESGRTAEASVTVSGAATPVPVRPAPGATGAKGGLAVTGFDPGLLPVLTVLTLIAGSGLLLAARRRHGVTHDLE